MSRQAVESEPTGPAQVQPYPWELHRALGRAVVRRQRSAMTLLGRLVDLPRLAQTLRDVTGQPQLKVECGVPVVRESPAASLGVDVELQTPDGGLFARLSLQRPLVTQLANALLEREGVREDPRRPHAERTLGLLNALVLEVCQRCALDVPLVLVDEPCLPAVGGILYNLAIDLGEQRFAGTAWLAVTEPGSPTPTQVHLDQLGELSIAVPLCVGACLAERRELELLSLGDVWLAGSGCWVVQGGQGYGCLVAPGEESGAKVELIQGGVVYKGDAVTIPIDPELADGPDAAEGAGNLHDVVLDSPVVVRLELGAVSMTARQWAEIKAGDVLETGKPVGTPVVLRVSGKEVASGQLVTVDGEIGVRITNVVR